MKKQTALVACALLAITLASCNVNDNQNINVATGSITEWEMSSVANYMFNFTKQTFTIDDFTGGSNNLLYVQQEITLPALLTPPETNPTRENYNFTGWYKTTECEELWDFANESATRSVFLYAGWEVTREGTYVEPVYTPPEIIDDNLLNNLTITGILNCPISYSSVNLTRGGLLRLANSPSDVRFALNYIRKSQTVITGAVYDAGAAKIRITSINGSIEEVVEIGVSDNSAAYQIANTNYEAKAVSYETARATSTNHHVLLAGSSSFEFWLNYEKDLAPIVAYNHGIGGTTAQDWTSSLLERLVIPYTPKAIVFYVGINNLINTSQDDTTIIAAVETLMEAAHARLPNAHIFYVLFNKLPGYFLGYSDRIVAINAALTTYISGKSWIESIDAGTILLKNNGVADAGYFRLDNLHLSEYGYVLWAAQIRKALQNWLG
jgi:lysophospholipase L1-like esterase